MRYIVVKTAGGDAETRFDGTARAYRTAGVLYRGTAAAIVVSCVYRTHDRGNDARLSPGACNITIIRTRAAAAARTSVAAADRC